MADEDAMLEAEVQRIQEQLKEVKRRKRERYAAMMREKNYQGTSRDDYDTSYDSEGWESEPEPGSAEALAKGMMAVQNRSRFNLQKLEEKYLDREKKRKPSDMIEFGSGGQVYYPENMPANQQQMHIDKIFRDDLNFGKGALCAPHNSEEVFHGDSKAWRESVKRDEMYREHKRKQKRCFPRPNFDDEDAYYRRILVESGRKRSKVKKEVESSGEDLSDEEFSEGNTSDDMSSEVFSSSEEDDDEEKEEDEDKEKDKVQPDNYVMTGPKTTPLRSRKSATSVFVKEEPSESKTPKERKPRTPNSRSEMEVLKTPLSENKIPRNQSNSNNTETFQSDTPESRISQKRRSEKKPEVLNQIINEKNTPRTRKIDSPQLKRVSPRTIKQEPSANSCQTLKVEVSETPTTRKRSRNMKAESSECSASTSTNVENETKLSMSITAESEIRVSSVKPELSESALLAMTEAKDSDELKSTTRPRYSKQNNSENINAAVNNTPKALVLPVSKSPSTQPRKSKKANDTNRDIENSTSSQQSAIVCKSDTPSEEQDIVVVGSVRGTSARRSQNRKRTLDQHWNTQPAIKTPKVNFETSSSSSLEVEFYESDFEGAEPSKSEIKRKCRGISKPLEGRIWGQEINFSEFGDKLFGVSTIYHNKLKISFFDVWISALKLEQQTKYSDNFDRDFRRFMSSNKKWESDIKAGYIHKKHT